MKGLRFIQVETRILMVNQKAMFTPKAMQQGGF
jgi:hypothetical protein